ncbi:MAG: IS66 family transposase [Deltaproteobacteria bacterium]
MTRDEAAAILKLPQSKAIHAILALAEKAEKYDEMVGAVSPTTPSGMTPTYLKPPPEGRKKRPGRKKGHPGVSRLQPEQVNHFKEHTLRHCPECHSPVKQPIKTYTRYVEDIPAIEKPEVTKHTLRGYWCSTCKKVVFPTFTDALPNAMIGLRLVVFTAWLHYLVGVSVHNIVKMLSVTCRFKISAGGLTQAWIRLARLLEFAYDHVGEGISRSGVLNADETGWRLNGITHWLWCFTTKTLCYYVITKSRGSPVIRKVLGSVFRGILICDFWGAYNKITALAKQRCFYHLFTELVKVDKSNKSPTWKAFRKKLFRLLRDAVRLSCRKAQLGPEKYESLKGRLYHRLEQILLVHHDGDKDVKRLIKRLKRHKAELFTFLEHENVSPYNNHAEQQMRKPVLTRKVSQQNRSAQGAKTQAVLMSLFRTAELQGQNPIEAVLSLAKSFIKDSAAKDASLKMAA